MSTVFDPPAAALELPLLAAPLLVELLLLLLPHATTASAVPASRHPFIAFPRNRILLLSSGCWALGLPRSSSLEGLSDLGKQPQREHRLSLTQRKPGIRPRIIAGIIR
jgi:hypothetical protein